MISSTNKDIMFLSPNSKLCAEMYGEGPDAYSDDEQEKQQNG